VNYSEAFSPEERLKMRRRWDAESAPLFFYRPLVYLSFTDSIKTLWKRLNGSFLHYLGHYYLGAERRFLRALNKNICRANYLKSLDGLSC